MIKPDSKICIIRLSALGDVCLFLPTLRILQRNFPKAEITWIIGPAEYRLVEGIENVEFVIYDKKSGFRGAFELGRKLKGRRFDVLLMAQEALRASVLSLFIKAEIRLGFDKARAKDFQTLFSNRRIAPHPGCHMLENYVDFARALGADDLAIEWNLPVPQAAFDEAAKIVDPVKKPYLLISPCTNVVRRNWRDWTIEGYAGVIDYAYQTYGLITVLSGGKSERERAYAEAIKMLAKVPVVDAVGKTSIKGLLALIQNAFAVVAPDSGPGHMAAALGTPAIALYAAANPRRAAPYQTPSFAVSRYEEAMLKFHQKGLDEVPFGERVRHPDAMGLITATDVIRVLDRLVKERGFRA